MAEYMELDNTPPKKPTYTVTTTLVDGGILTCTNSTGAEPKLNFLLIGFDDHTIIIPDHQIRVVTIKQNGEMK